MNNQNAENTPKVTIIKRMGMAMRNALTRKRKVLIAAVTVIAIGVFAAYTRGK